MKGSQDFKKVHLQRPSIESIITNPAYVAALLEGAQCETREAVEKVLEEEIRGDSWNNKVRGFEQHMLEESEVRVDWMAGKFVEVGLVCSGCGDLNAWDCVHTCCQDECKRHINALQAFPLAAWDDISAAPEPRNGQDSQVVGNQVCRTEACVGEDNSSKSEANGLEESETEMDRYQ